MAEEDDLAHTIAEIEHAAARRGLSSRNDFQGTAGERALEL